jgi:hypothetical protein
VELTYAKAGIGVMVMRGASQRLTYVALILEEDKKERERNLAEDSGRDIKKLKGKSNSQALEQ